MALLGMFCKQRELRRLLGQRRERLFRMAFAWSHDPALADDLVQETMEKALKRANQLRDLATLDRWLFGILGNCFRDHLRRQRPLEELEEHTLADPETPERQHEQRHIVTQVRCAIERLPEGQRQVVTLVDLEGFSYAEVADILGIPIGTVMSRLCRARRQLSQELVDIEPLRTQEPPRLRRIK